jgi:hypothetical protein
VPVHLDEVEAWVEEASARYKRTPIVTPHVVLVMSGGGLVVAGAWSPTFPSFGLRNGDSIAMRSSCFD